MAGSSAFTTPIHPTDEPRRSRRGLFAALSTLLVLLVAETAGFVGFWIADGKPFSWSRLQAERDGVLGRGEPAASHAARPGSEVRHPYLGYVLDPDGADEVSELGFLASGDPLPKRSEGTVVLGVVGGSVAADFAARGAQTLVAELRRSAEFEGVEFSVVNLAMGGYKQPQQLITLTYLLALGAEFDIVINLDGFNEVALHVPENARKDVFPIYPRNWYARVGGVPDATARDLVGRLWQIESRMGDAAAAFSKRPLRFSITANLVWRLWHERLSARRWALEGEFRGYRPEQVPYLLTGPRLERESGVDVHAHLAEIWMRCSLQMDRISRANEIRYYHFLQPNQYLEGSKALTPEESRSAWRQDQPYRLGVEAGYPFLIDFGRRLREQNVRFQDLSQAFRDDSRSLYADDCCHYNEQGNQVIARRIADAILEERSRDARADNSAPI